MEQQKFFVCAVLQKWLVNSCDITRMQFAEEQEVCLKSSIAFRIQGSGNMDVIHCSAFLFDKMVAILFPICNLEIMQLDFKETLRIKLIIFLDSG